MKFLGRALWLMLACWQVQASAQEPANPCAKADGLVAVGLLDEARAAYGAVAAEQDDVPPCVAAGFDGLSQGYLDRGRDALALGDRAAARQALSAAFALRTSLPPEARAAWVARENTFRRLLRSTREDPFAGAAALAALGDLDAAREAARAAMKDSGEPLPKDLGYLFAQGWRPWERLRNPLMVWLPRLVEMALAAFFAGLLLWSLWRVARRSLVIEAFTDDASRGSDDVGGETFARLVQAHLAELAGGSEHSLNAMVDNEAHAVAVPDIAGQVLSGPQGFAALVQSLLALVPGAPYRVSGVLLHAPSRGLGVTVRLLCGNRTLAAETLWEDSFRGGAGGDDLGTFRLADAVAVWALFEVSNQRRLRSPLRFLGARNWRSVALVRSGVHYFTRSLAGERALRQRARRLFQTALLLDRGCFAAHANLGRLLQSTGVSASSAVAQGHFAMAVAQLRDPAAREPDVELPVMPAAAAPAPGAAPQAAPAFWSRLHDRLVAATSEEPGFFGGTRLEPFERDAFHYFATRYGQLSLLAGSLLKDPQACGREQASRLAEALVPEVEAVALKLRRRLQWRLLRRRSGSPAARDQRALGIVESVARSLRPVLMALELLPPVPSGGDWPDRLRRLVRDADSALDGLFAFNTAVLLANLARWQQQDAQGEWVVAAVRLFQRASELQPHRQAEAEKDDGYRYLESLGVIAGPPAIEKEAPVPTLASVELIGAELAAALEERSIVAAADLLLATAQPAQRSALAFDLEVDEALVLRWARLAEVLALPGVEIDHGNLLERAALGSLPALQALSPVEVEARLAAVGRALSSDPGVERATLKAWCEEAARRRTVVQ